MKFCSVCGHEVQLSVPPGDNRPRYGCAHCGTIHYQNPRLVLGTVPVWQGQVLLCRRAIEPRYGFWTLPAGFMENGETTGEGAQRETVEEAGARIALGEPFSMIDVPHVNQVHVFYLAEMLEPSLDPGPESLEAKLFAETAIPWDAIAFRTVEQTLRWYFADRARGAFSMHVGAFRQRPPGKA
ncbi:MAG: NUDIX domain-containing protein [Lautropia sp.]|nr:MAG: NUDIX domain-containing protein [Pseudomonadota bacterium]MBC6959227.1 NUDIX domain-containing protein [Lautropia sp.]MCL4701474.1 zinc ribbon domain-containing protein [Burkholderiaceae bacterium]MCZ2413953.1 NUDIX hydrolase [Burkholderiales bacterium]MDL1907293.1 NUDIX domain-containing protein [Betaproteobacteria bacterium PRO1]